MSNINNMNRLLATLLKDQIQPESVQSLSFQRIREALTIGPAFTPEEKKILLSSPIARFDTVQIAEEIAEEIEMKFEDSNLSLHLFSLVADSETVDELTLKGENFSVCIHRHPGDQNGWFILLQLEPSVLEKIYPMTVVRLSDDTGAIWLEGSPDALGEMVAHIDQEVNLIAHLKQHYLKLDIV